MSRRLHQYSKREACYYCGSLCTGKEHVPPKMLFKSVGCDSITVPSCDEHNTDKTGSDEAFLTGLCMATALWRGRYNKDLPESACTTADRIAANFHQPNLVTVDPFLTNPPPGIDEDSELVRLSDDIGVALWIRQLSAGILWSALGGYTHLIDWDTCRVWSPTLHQGPVTTTEALTFFEATRAMKESLYEETWNPGWGDGPGYPPEIYTFEIAFSDRHDDGLPVTIIRHTFFTWATWYIFCPSSWRTRKELQSFLEA